MPVAMPWMPRGITPTPPLEEEGEVGEWQKLWESIIGRNRVPFEERSAFRSWYAARRELGWWRGVAVTTPSYRLDDPFYQEWVSLGKPSAEEWKVSQEEARVAGLEPWELRAEIGEGPYFIDEYPEQPFPPTEGFEWVEITSDPATGEPLRPQWDLQPIEEPDEETGRRYVTEDGVLYEVTYNLETGEETERTFVSFVPQWIGESPDELTAWEESQIERWETEQAFEKEKFTALQEWQVLQTREAAAGRRGAAQLRREEIEAGLTGPRDWVKYWDAQRATKQGRIGNLQEEAMGHLQAAQSLTGSERLKEEMAAERLYDIAAGLTEKLQAAPATPPTPEWLPQHLIGGAGRRGVTVPGVGEPIQRLPVRTPSPQQMGGMAQTERLGLAGFADWAAQDGSRTWLDILGHQEQMLPRGVTGGQFARWQPATQRA